MNSIKKYLITGHTKTQNNKVPASQEDLGDIIDWIHKYGTDNLGDHIIDILSEFDKNTVNKFSQMLWEYEN